MLVHTHQTQIKGNVNRLIDNPRVGKSFFFFNFQQNERPLHSVCIVDNPSFTIMPHRLHNFNCPFPLQPNGCLQTYFLTPNPGSTRIIIHDVQTEALQSHRSTRRTQTIRHLKRLRALTKRCWSCLFKPCR